MAVAKAKRITAKKPAKPPKGSPQAVLAALRRLPPLNPDDVEELFRLIEEGKRESSRAQSAQNYLLNRRFTQMKS